MPVLGREQARQRAAQRRPPPRDPPSHQARQTAALLTAAAYGPINAWCFVAPSTTGLGLWSRVALRVGQLVGEYGGDIRGLTLSFQDVEMHGRLHGFEGFGGCEDRPGAVAGGVSSIEDRERIAELEGDITKLRTELDKSRQETKTVRPC